MKIILTGTIDKAEVLLGEDGNWYCSYAEYIKTHKGNRHKASFIRWCKRNNILPTFI